MKEQARAKARQLAQEFLQRGDATGWFEELYAQAQGNEQAIHWADVEYVVADVFDPPRGWRGSFDFVLEAYTLQVLPAAVRSKAIASIAGLLTKEGTLLVICRGRSPEEPQGVLPWPLTTEELNLFKSAGLRQVQLEDYFDQEEPPKKRFRVEYQRA